MIYLIDDNKSRQKDFGWTEERFEQYGNLLTPLYTINDVINIGDNLYYDNNIILYHESFLDFTGDKKKAVEQRSKLSDLASSNNLLSIAIFSGSQSSRSLAKNIAHIPVAVLYRNLEILIQQYAQNNGNLEYLLFGENSEIERELDTILTESNINIESDPVIIGGRNLFIRPNNRYIQNAIEGAKVVPIFSDVSDEKLSQKVNEWLMQEEYDNIFLPLCFGQTLSDFNGLRLATHIRCSETPNQLKRIFIYSFVGIEYLLQNEYFNILKTKGVKLVDYSKNAFKEATGQKMFSLHPLELVEEIKKLELQPPKNYLDNHSIANEWAIHQWSKTIGCDETDELTKVFQNVEGNLYFKYLRTINPISEIDRISPEELEIEYSEEPKILYIDDEAEKGWYEIFCTILHDTNNLEFQHIDVELQSKTRDEIIKYSIEKIESEEIDLVLLDFRLHPDDFNTKNIQDITGLKLLIEIKITNPGVRVIIFSATNKIWNLIELQNAGADAFIIKESPDTSVSSSFTKETIEMFSNVLQEQLKYVFLKELFNYCQVISQMLFAQDVDENEDYDKFIKTLLSQIRTIRSSISLINISKPATIDIVFLSCFNFLELFKTYYLNENKKDYRYYIGFEEEILISYNVPYRTNTLQNNGEWLPNEKMKKPTWFNTIAALFIDYLKVSSDPFQEVIQLARIAEWRNDYIHNSKEHFTVNELKLIFSSLALITSKIKE
jgi:CheY-like chemotaxis protein